MMHPKQYRLFLIIPASQIQFGFVSYSDVSLWRVKLHGSFLLAVSVCRQIGPYQLSIIPVTTFILGIAVEGIIGH